MSASIPSAATCSTPRSPRWGGAAASSWSGFVGGVQQIPANRLLVKHRAALGSSLRYFRWHAPDKLRRSVDELLQWYRRGQAAAAGQRPPAARAQRRGHPPADRPQGPRQARGAAGVRGAHGDPRRGARPRRRPDDRQPAAHERHDARDDGRPGPTVGRAGARPLPLHRADRRRASAPSAPAPT